MISKPNKKTGIYSFSIHNKVCRNIKGCQEQQCFKYCYANKALRMYKATREFYTRNLHKTIYSDFVDNMIKELNKLCISHFRIHVCGEFYSQEYFNKWLEIARLKPEITFFTYTKNIDLDFSKRPKNLIIRLSNDNNLDSFKEHYSRFDGVCTIRQKDEEPIKGFIACRAQTDKLTCAECRLCALKRTSISFRRH